MLIASMVANGLVLRRILADPHQQAVGDALLEEAFFFLVGDKM